MSTTAAGVPAGTNTPHHGSIAMSGKPASIKVGTSGSARVRFDPVTARARTRPSLTCPTAQLVSVEVKSMSPICSALSVSTGERNATRSALTPIAFR